MIQSPVRFAFRPTVLLKRFRRRKPGMPPCRQLYLFTDSSVSVQRSSQRVFRNWNDIEGGAEGPLKWASVNFLYRNALRVLLLLGVLQRARGYTNVQGTDYSYAVGFELSARRGFIVRPEVIPMLIPLCSRGWTERRAAAAASRRPSRHDYAKRNDSPFHQRDARNSVGI